MELRRKSLILFKLLGAGLAVLMSVTCCSASEFLDGELGSVSLAQFFAERPNFQGYEPFGAEGIGAEDDEPRIPEPMVFDLVRPLGARRGELEVNVLALIPLNQRVGLNRIPDPIGLVPDDRHRTEVAPEVELALWDGFAIEFELPFEETRLEAYKMAAQWTFGTAFDNQFIHGTQGILFYDRDTGNWTPTLLYIAGVRFDEYWSMLAMIGFQTELNSDDVMERTQRLINVTLFRDVTNYMSVGLESNYAESLTGAASWLIMPQVHWEITDYWMLQWGAGVSFTQHYSLPMASFRLIREF